MEIRNRDNKSYFRNIEIYLWKAKFRWKDRARRMKNIKDKTATNMFNITEVGKL
jgi:hypothetical protein